MPTGLCATPKGRILVNDTLLILSRPDSCWKKSLPRCSNALEDFLRFYTRPPTTGALPLASQRCHLCSETTMTLQIPCLARVPDVMACALPAVMGRKSGMWRHHQTNPTCRAVGRHINLS